MSRELITEASFSCGLKKYLRQHPDSDSSIESILERLATEPFHPQLGIHQLSGRMKGLWAIEAAYDLRIVFYFGKRKPPEEAAIILVDIGTHDQVY